MTHLFSRAALLGVVAAFAAGCAGDSERPQVRGRVTVKGEPLAGKTLTLVFDAPAGEGFGQMLTLGSDGGFDGAVPQPGKYKVVIGESLAVMDGFEKAPAGAKRIRANKKYFDAATTDLVWEVAPGKNEKTFDLQE